MVGGHTPGYAALSSELAANDSLELQASGEDLEAIIRALAPERAQRVLDVGCGTGALARLLALRAGPDVQVVGIDRAPEHIEYSRRAARLHSIDNVTFEVQDFFEVDFAAEFDLVYCRYVLMYVIPTGRCPDFLMRMRRCLRPGGRAALIEADINFGQDRYPPPPIELADVLSRVVTYYREQRQIEWRAGVQLYHHLHTAGFDTVDVTLGSARIIQGGTPRALTQHDGQHLEDLIAPFVEPHRCQAVARAWRTYLEDEGTFIFSPIFIGTGTVPHTR